MMELKINNGAPEVKTNPLNMRTQICCACYMTWAVPERFDTDRKADGKNFYWPRGHGQSYDKTAVK